MSPLRLASVIVVLALCAFAFPAVGGLNDAEAKNGKPSQDMSGSGDEIYFDLAAGTVRGVKFGLDEEHAREAMESNGLTAVTKVEYPDYFLLQSEGFPGLVFNFRNQQLTHVYSNSRKLRFSNGLRLGQSLKTFAEYFGPPVSTAELPSKVGNKVVFTAGPWEMAVVQLHTDPKTAHAVTIRRH